MRSGPLRLAHLTTIDASLLFLLATELRLDVECGFEVYGLSAPGSYGADVEALGIRHIPIPALTRSWEPGSDARAARQLWAAIRQLDLHILHTHNPKTGVLGRILGRLARVPVVVNTCHGLWMRPEDAMLRRATVLAVEAFASQFSHAELYQNDEDRRQLQWAMRDGKSKTVGNGIDLERFRPDPVGRNAVRRGLGLTEDGILVGGVGRQVEEKGLREFAAAARALGHRARFVWVGPKDADKADHLPAALEGVELLGMQRDMPAVYSAFDIFALPTYREGFSRSSMEAAACGCALVLSDVRGCREIGTHEEHVLFVPPHDSAALTAAVARLLDDADLRKRLASNAQTRAQAAFDQRVVAAASLATYRAVARRKRLDWWSAIPEP